MARKNTKERIVRAARDLLIEVGYESMSPAMVITRSGAGKGSLYHYFSGKKQLARAALETISDELQCEAVRILDDHKTLPADRLENYLKRKRNGLMGCKLGRLCNEKALSDVQLHEPLEQYFTLLLELTGKAIRQAVADGTYCKDTPVRALAHLIVASVQGGYVLSKAIGDKEGINLSTQGARALLAAYRQKGKE